MFKHAAIILSCATALTLGTASSASANNDAAMEQALAALDATLPGTLINNPYDIQWRTDGSDKVEKIVESPGVPGGMAYQVRIKKTKRNAWDTATRMPMTTDIKKGEVILLSFWARTAKPPKGKETGNISVSLQRNVEPYDGIIEEQIDLGTEWKLYSFAGTASRDYSAEKTNLNFNLAKAKQTVEFGTYYISSLGEDVDPAPYLK